MTIITRTGASNRTVTFGDAHAKAVVSCGIVHLLCGCGAYVDDVRQSPSEPDTWVCECGRAWQLDPMVREVTT